uniref:PB1-like domain-containing protein n=1 Tax=Lactuca sativa TaxID=4236 RepID=A0A9R1UEI4_LACSA|nr:hypothetical protein LSAT_V11C900463570 [Lactuca sativa]
MVVHFCIRMSALLFYLLSLMYIPKHPSTPHLPPSSFCSIKLANLIPYPKNLIEAIETRSYVKVKMIRPKNEVVDVSSVYAGAPTWFNIKLHHGGKFTKLPDIKYIGCEVRFVDYVDMDEFYVHELDAIMLDLGNHQDVINLSKFIPNNKLIDVYTGHVKTNLLTYFICPNVKVKVVIEVLPENNDQGVEVEAEVHVESPLRNMNHVNDEPIGEYMSLILFDSKSGGNLSIRTIYGGVHQQPQFLSLSEFSEYDKEACQWLKQNSCCTLGKESFLKAVFDVLNSNMCEVFNVKIEKGRDKPVIGCLDFIREYLMKRIYNVMKEMKKVTRALQDQHVVDVRNQTCTCRKYAIATLNEMSKDPKDELDVYKWVHKVEPIKGRPMWPKSNCPTKLIPPLHHTWVERPKKKEDKVRVKGRGQLKVMKSMLHKEKVPKDQQMMECRSYQGRISMLLVANSRIRDTTLGHVKGKVGISLRSGFGCLLWYNDYLLWFDDVVMYGAHTLLCLNW